MKKPTAIGRHAQTEKLWNSLVESAFDFFDRAVQEHDKSPKYAILHLAASVELFLKARLMAEHWTLIISPKKTPTFDQLRTGDFVSVTLSESIERLRGVLPSEEIVGQDAASEFTDLAKERNKIAHFFHSGLEGDEKPKFIIQRQCRVWLHLHRLLANVWKETFSKFDANLRSLDSKMRDERKFLKTIFDDVQSELEDLRKKGHPIVSCPACEFEALVLGDVNQYTNGQCLVCRYQSKLMLVKCPDCEKEIRVEHGYDHCPKCNHSFTPHELGSVAGGKQQDDDTGFGSLPINCSECGTDEVYEIDERYICMNCMTDWDEISTCEWCNESNTGNMEESYLFGCSMCDGMIGWKGDRD